MVANILASNDYIFKGIKQLWLSLNTRVPFCTGNDDSYLKVVDEFLLLPVLLDDDGQFSNKLLREDLGVNVMKLFSFVTDDEAQ
jgi:hypothetical protein